MLLPAGLVKGAFEVAWEAAVQLYCCQLAGVFKHQVAGKRLARGPGAWGDRSGMAGGRLRHREARQALRAWLLKQLAAGPNRPACGALPDANAWAARRRGSRGPGGQMAVESWLPSRPTCAALPKAQV